MTTKWVQKKWENSNDDYTFKDLMDMCPFIYAIEDYDEYDIYIEAPGREDFFHVKPFYKNQHDSPRVALSCVGTYLDEFWLIVTRDKLIRSLKNMRDEDGERLPITKKNKWLHLKIAYKKNKPFEYKITLLENWNETNKQEFYDRIREIIQNKLY